MKFLLYSTLLATLTAGLLPAAAQEHTYDVVTANVPFKFSVGHRTFWPGPYQFILLGPGLLALRDAKMHMLATLIARPVESGEPAQATRLTFRKENKQERLAQIHIANRSQVLEILGEELAVRSVRPQTPPLPADSFSFSGRSDVPRLKQ